MATDHGATLILVIYAVALAFSSCIQAATGGLDAPYRAATRSPILISELCNDGLHSVLSRAMQLFLLNCSTRFHRLSALHQGPQQV